MAKRADKSVDKAGSVEPETPKMHAESGGASDVAPPEKPAESSLPIVESPKLDAGDNSEPAAVETGAELPFEVGAVIADLDAKMAAETTLDHAAVDTAGAAPARSMRFALLAATIALVAASGAFLGVLAASGMMHLFAAAAPTAHTADPNSAAAGMRAELTAIKSALDGANRSTNADFTKLADRLDRIEKAQADPAKLAHIADTLDRVERAETDPTGKLAHIADSVDRLNKQSVAASAPETTGSIASAASPATSPKSGDRILTDWIVQDVRSGRAVVESRYGGVFVVGAGSILPRVGAVEEVKRQDGQWVVVTAAGIITSGR